MRRRLCGISANVLTSRLAHLRRVGLVERVPLNDPSGADVYRLTGEARGCLEVIDALHAWGGQLP